MDTKLPLFLKPYFWSYNFDNLTIEKHPRSIVQALLHYGNQEATEWLFSTYPKNTIRDVFATTYRGEYDRKSLHLWETVFNLKLKDRADVIANA